MWVRAEREEPPTEAAAKVANAALLIDVRFGFGQSSSSVCGRVCGTSVVVCNCCFGTGAEQEELFCGKHGFFQREHRKKRHKTEGIRANCACFLVYLSHTSGTQPLLATNRQHVRPSHPSCICEKNNSLLSLPFSCPAR